MFRVRVWLVCWQAVWSLAGSEISWDGDQFWPWLWPSWCSQVGHTTLLRFIFVNMRFLKSVSHLKMWLFNLNRWNFSYLILPTFLGGQHPEARSRGNYGIVTDMVEICKSEIYIHHTPPRTTKRRGARGEAMGSLCKKTCSGGGHSGWTSRNSQIIQGLYRIITNMFPEHPGPIPGVPHVEVPLRLRGYRDLPHGPLSLPGVRQLDLQISRWHPHTGGA